MGGGGTAGKGRETLPASHGTCYDSRHFPDESRIGWRGMNAFMEMSHEDVLRVKLEVLRREHRDLDEAIHALETAQRGDPLTLRRLKKQKLMLKDQIARIEDQLTPDIIA